MAIDLGARGRDLDQAAQRLVVLQALTAALARTRTYPEIAEVIIGQALPALKAEVGVVALASADERWLRNVGFKGVDSATEDAWRDYSVDAPVPVAEAARTRTAIIVRTLAERNTRYPVLAQIHGLEHGGPVTAFPLIVDSKLLGVLAFCWGAPLELDPADLTFLQTLADQCGLAIERARLYEVAARELSERKASEAKLQEANDRKDEFLAMLGHELRNPLASIRSATDVLGDLSRTRENIENTVARVHDVLERQTGHMKRLIDDLLDLSRLVSGQLSVKLERLDLVELVRSSTADHASAFLGAGIDLNVTLPPERLWMRADATRLAQALANLLDNSLKFSERGSTVHVLLERSEDRAVIDVRDEGAGIESGLLTRLFTPFVQADCSLARTSGGLGLGLSLVQGFVRLHEGTISVASEGPGKGSLFRLSLPLLLDPEQPRLVSTTLTLPAAQQRVLVVEDNEDAAEMLGMLLEASGHEVRLTHRATHALAMLAEWWPDVVLSDIGLPDMDGFAFARCVHDRAHEREGARPYLVAITGYGGQRDRERARDAGFDAHVVKPIDVRTLEQVLSRNASTAALNPSERAPDLGAHSFAGSMK